MTLDLKLDIKMHRPEVLEKLRTIANPYNYSTYKLDYNNFVGRAKELKSLNIILNQYEKNAQLRNITIYGEKSIGKSTLLNRFKQILIDHDFAIYEVELSTDKTRNIDEYSFFKDIFNHFYDEYAPIENTCLDATQQEIWYKLTAYHLQDDSNFMKRKIGFATLYSNFLLGRRQELPYTILEKDFNSIIEALFSPALQYKGIAILIDEFHELKRNLFIVDTLRKLSENLLGIMVIGSGLPEFAENKSFEKFIRTSLPISLDSIC